MEIKHEQQREMPVMTLEKAHDIMTQLAGRGVDTVLYGSLGVSIYLGAFKEFGDVDLLVSPEWMGERWGELQDIMGDLGYRLVDAKEHEFHGPREESVAFAPLSIFARDNIVFNAENDVVNMTVGDVTITTFTPELFKRAYEFSVHDGYRTEERGKKDRLVIELLEAYSTQNNHKE